MAKHGPDRCSLGSTKGLEEKELVALASNKDLSFTYVPNSLPALEREYAGVTKEPVPSLVHLELPPPSVTVRSPQDPSQNPLVTASRWVGLFYRSRVGRNSQPVIMYRTGWFFFLLGYYTCCEALGLVFLVQAFPGLIVWFQRGYELDRSPVCVRSTLAVVEVIPLIVKILPYAVVHKICPFTCHGAFICKRHFHNVASDVAVRCSLFLSFAHLKMLTLMWRVFETIFRLLFWPQLVVGCSFLWFFCDWWKELLSLSWMLAKETLTFTKCSSSIMFWLIVLVLGWREKNLYHCILPWCRLLLFDQPHVICY